MSSAVGLNLLPSAIPTTNTTVVSCPLSTTQDKTTADKSNLEVHDNDIKHGNEKDASESPQMDEHQDESDSEQNEGTSTLRMIRNIR